MIYRHVPAEERHERARQALKKSALAGAKRTCRANCRAVNNSASPSHVRSSLKPQVLFADEPTGNLDTATSSEIMKLLTKLNEESGITIAMVTHEPDIAAWTRRIVRFRDGTIESDDANSRCGQTESG